MNTVPLALTPYDNMLRQNIKKRLEFAPPSLTPIPKDIGYPVALQVPQQVVGASRERELLLSMRTNMLNTNEKMKNQRMLAQRITNNLVNEIEKDYQRPRNALDTYFRKKFINNRKNEIKEMNQAYLTQRQKDEMNELHLIRMNTAVGGRVAREIDEEAGVQLTEDEMLDEMAITSEMADDDGYQVSMSASEPTRGGIYAGKKGISPAQFEDFRKRLNSFLVVPNLRDLPRDLLKKPLSSAFQRASEMSKRLTRSPSTFENILNDTKGQGLDAKEIYDFTREFTRIKRDTKDFDSANREFNRLGNQIEERLIPRLTKEELIREDTFMAEE